MRPLGVAFLISLLGFAPAASEGCGDKFQRVGRGARFQRGYVALHPACILLYARPQSPVAQALRDLEPALARAGHKPLVVDAREKLAPALETGHYNIVMADPADAAAVRDAARSLATPPSILPVLHKPTPEAKKSAAGEFTCLVSAPGKQVDVLAEIDGLMERRAKTGAAASDARR
jgi:hypothetical protein